ncbi:FAD-binding oxidoreductase [Kribbella sp. VKM Ac-2568]|uniref:FAD-binding oxidoreductase n=1 Tax=Kribbella sp. VKM Ac-2568 TaxID=2512219 RepID=UPI0010523785|nr:FAD-binding oxidoreductase [Kribbella sp. VKM Ac-2568]TCM45718.1 alkyldihydroxyacetonephosphate synthase [Kribbella sp. VKM Ac-2568]
MTESDLPVVQLTPGRWGDPAHPVELPAAAVEALKHLGVRRPAAPVVDPAVRRTAGEGEAAGDAAPGGSTDDPELTLAAREVLEKVLGAEHVKTDFETRWGHTRGYSTPDLLRHRAGDTSDLPAAVVYPGSHDEVLALLTACDEHRIAISPYAGGTSVVGGLAPQRATFIAVDLRRLNRLVSIDEISRTATLEAGVRGTAAEAILTEHGYTLGHFPQSYEGASIGGYAATRSSGQSSAGYGRFDQMVVGLTLATPRGTVELGRAPMSAAGPDLRQLVLGSEGAFGIITSVVLRIRPRPTERSFEGWKFASFDEGLTAIRRLAQDGPLPTVLRLSDEAETAINLADPDVLGGGTGGVLAIVGFEGTHTAVRRAEVAEVLTAAGGESLGKGPGETWRQGRYRAPYLRDPLLDEGALVETLETAGFWSTLPALKAKVTEALVAALAEQGTPPLVLCHVSHVYETGASLYFTVISAQTDDAVAQWRKAKAAASQAIAEAGGTITHHHAVGTDHRDAYVTEIGPLAVEALQAVKHVLDPNGILNPGILLPED